MPSGGGLTYTDACPCYIMMNIWISSFLIACILAAGQNWPYLQYFWKNSICLLIQWAASAICKRSPASSLVEVSPVCYGGWWPTVGPTWGREPSNHKPCCRKGRGAQAAAARTTAGLWTTTLTWQPQQQEASSTPCKTVSILMSPVFLSLDAS